MNRLKAMATKKRFLFPAGGVILLIVIWVVGFRSSGGTTLPTYTLERSDFIVSLVETGELRATNSVVITAPPVRGGLQIIYLAPKGEDVNTGDTLIVFDGTDWQKKIEEAESKLEISNANLKKSRASMASNMAQIQAQLESAQASYRLAELRLEQMQFEADVKKEEQQLSLEQSRINLEQAQKRIEQQETIDAAEIVTYQLQVKQAEADLEKAKKDLERLTILAPQPGLVVYKKIWKGGEFSEIKIGDTPWRGQALIELPDLSQMEVETSVNEVDVARVEPGQKVDVVLDAFPNKVFEGEVIEVSNLARIDEQAVGEVKVFDVIVRIKQNDPLLKPGMTVSATIIIETVPDALAIPIDAVFQEGGESIVYRGKGSFKPVPVKLGIRNENFVIVNDGLKDGDTICLVDPSKPFDTESWGGKTETASKSRNSGKRGASGKRTHRTVIIR